MIQKSLYFKIGVFILLGILLLILAIIGFGAGKLFRKEIMFETYFDGSVQGLDIGSPVKYRGVKIGEVKDILVVSQEYRKNDDFNIDASYVMIKMILYGDSFPFLKTDGLVEKINKLVDENGLRVKFAYLGITGLAYLEIDFVAPEDNIPLDISWKPKYIYIPSVPNTMQLVADSIDDIAKALTDDFIPLIKNLYKVSQDFPKLSKTVDEILIQLQETLSNINQASTTVPELSLQLQNALKSVNDL